jgi:hypothetical protein
LEALIVYPAPLLDPHATQADAGWQTVSASGITLRTHVLTGVSADWMLLHETTDSTSPQIPESHPRHTERKRWSTRRKMFEILLEVWGAAPHRWNNVCLVHTLCLLWLPLHSKWRGPKRRLLGHDHSVGQGPTYRRLRLRLRPWSLLHDTRTGLLRRHPLRRGRLPCQGSHEMLAGRFSLVVCKYRSSSRTDKL